jgi:regulator of protease activity HflC (stomatin/prohibitin superfamily)
LDYQATAGPDARKHGEAVLKAANIFVTILAAISLTGCSRVSADAGEQRVLIEKPWFFGHGGIDDQPVTAGATWVAWSTDSVNVSMQPLRFDEEFDDMMSANNVPVSFRAAVRLQVTDSVELVRHFSGGYTCGTAENAPQLCWYSTNVQRMFQNLIRSDCKRYTMSQLAIDQSSVQELESTVKTELESYLASQKMPVKVYEVVVGKVSPPKIVEDQQKETAAQQQRAQTEAQKKIAEDARKAAEVSRAAADSAYQTAMGLSSQQFVELQRIKMCAEKATCQVFLGSMPVPVVGKQ